MTTFLWIIASIWLLPLTLFAGVIGGCGASRRWRRYWKTQLFGEGK
jgi:hypothetical protein